MDAFPDNYFDWKITCTFYCALHLLKSLGEFLGINIGESHKEIFSNIKPNNAARLLLIKDKAYDAYSMIFDYSRVARYDGIFDSHSFEIIKRNDYLHCRSKYEYLRKYITMERGVNV